MEITADTKIHGLLEEYPYLLDFLAAYDTEFQKLKNPVLRATLTRVASLEAAAEMADIPVSKLVSDVKAEVERHELGGTEQKAAPHSPVAEGVFADMAGGASAGAAALAGAGAPVGETRRQEILKEIIRDLHAGRDREQIKARFAELIQEVEPGEIAAMEQALIAEGMPTQEIQGMCDIHVSVFKESLENLPEGEALPHGHPLDTFVRENEVVAELTSSLRCYLDALAAGEGSNDQTLRDLSADLERLREVDTHYLRKENQLFPLLERHGVSGPTQVMWAIHDDIRARLKQVREALAANDADRVRAELPELLTMIEDMAYKEEKILFPVGLEQLSDEEWAQVRAGEEHIGYAWIQPRGEAPAATSAPPASRAQGGEGALLPLTTGAIPAERIDLLLRNLPFDLTYVDENDEVRYYSEGERVFPRSPAVIGRNVENCHPPKSVHVVRQIVQEFKAGTKNVAEFWIQLEGRFIYIRYFAIRDDEGAYRGVLEVVQDLTEARSLEGNRRLLDW